jgi:hypothetical protein
LDEVRRKHYDYRARFYDLPCSGEMKGMAVMEGIVFRHDSYHAREVHFLLILLDELK